MNPSELPCFSNIDTDAFQITLSNLLDAQLSETAVLLQQENFTWDNLMRPLEEMDDAIERLWSPFSHLHAVKNSKALRDCYEACLPKLSAYQAAMGQNTDLYEAIQSIDPAPLDHVQKKIIQDTLRDFKLSGVTLSPEKKRRLEAVETRLSELANQFENNILDAAQAFEYLVEDENTLQGLPAHALETARKTAADKEHSGWLLNLEFPCYLAVITYADNRSLRETFYEAWITRASDKGPHAGKFDNSAILEEILALRQETAELLGFHNYAECSLAGKMAGSTHEVLDFLEDLSARAYPQALKEIQQLETFARTEFNLDIIRPWDIAWLAEKMRQKLYGLSQEELRPYFPADRVLSGLFTVLEKLYGIHIECLSDYDRWHSDVLCCRLIDKNKNPLGCVYLDLYARQNKRGGAWMDSLQGRRRLNDGRIQLPIALLTCNFAKSGNNRPATLSHDEVITLFHEFGHCLQHLLTQVDYLGASGINGVEWDAVELPSQIFENWCWEKEVLHMLSEHVDSGEPLPFALYEKMLAAKNFQSAMAMMRQLEFSLFDFKIHLEYQKNTPAFIQSVLDKVREKTSVVPVLHYNRFQHSFSHIFAGGYGAGYYSYKWAEVLSSDAYQRFEEEGIFNPKTGNDFLQCILAAGSSVTAREAFIAFRGRPAKIDALLRHNGIL